MRVGTGASPVRRTRGPLHSEICQPFHRPRQHRLRSLHHQRALDHLGVRGHEADQLLVGEFPLARGLAKFFRPQRLLRLQSRLAQDLLQLGGRERLLQVIYRLELDPLVGQDPPDLAAGASGGLLVDGYFVVRHDDNIRAERGAAGEGARRGNDSRYFHGSPSGALGPT